jgi:two-component system, sensor histidine kinase and response regulator
LTILLAEDNGVNQTLATRLLEKRGHTVVLAETGRAVLEAVEKQTFDLVLMDVQMPEMDGLEATRAIRQKERTSGKHLPIIAMTANAMVGDKERCLQSGMDSYVAKPLSVKGLFGAIEGLVTHQVAAFHGRPASATFPDELNLD